MLTVTDPDTVRDGRRWADRPRVAGARIGLGVRQETAARPRRVRRSGQRTTVRAGIRGSAPRFAAGAGAGADPSGRPEAVCTAGEPLAYRYEHAAAGRDEDNAATVERDPQPYGYRDASMP